MLTNIQPPEPQTRDDNGQRLSVHSIFYTIQGEGPFTGWPAVFIRLAGCNLQCPGCDTEYTSGRMSMDIVDIVERARDTFLTRVQRQPQLVVITGGEPMRQNIAPLIGALFARFGRDTGFTVQIESNGVLPVTRGILDEIKKGRTFLIVSPKTSKIHPTCGTLAAAFKYVLDADNIELLDGLPTTALGHRAQPFVARPPQGFTGRVYVNPMDEQDPVKNQRNIEAVARSSMQFGYIAGVQMHKILNVA